jgi:hypothetical protein
VCRLPGIWPQSRPDPRRGRLLAIGVVLTGASLLASPQALGAGPVAAIAVNPVSGPPLTNVEITGTGFCPAPCAPVAIAFNSLYVSSGVSVGSDGRFTTVVRVPGTVGAGTIRIEASQTDVGGSVTTASTSFTVTPSTPAPTSYPTPSNVQPPSGMPQTTNATQGGGTRSGTTTTDPTSSSSTSPSTTLKDRSAATASVVNPASQSPALGVILGAAGALLAVGAGAVAWRRRQRHRPS